MVFRQAGKKQVILPGAVDQQIVARVALSLEPGIFKETNGRHVRRNAGRFNTVKVQNVETKRQDHGDGCGHVPFAGMALAHPVAKCRSLADAAADVAQRQAAENLVRPGAEQKKGQAAAFLAIARIAPQAPAEARLGEIVGGPERFPRLQEAAAFLAQVEAQALKSYIIGGRR